MKQTPEETKSPPTSYRRTYRRHRKLLAVPMVLGALVAAFFAFHSTSSYTSAASIWVDTAPPAASSITASNGMSTPPASAEQGILTELLTTDSFAVSVAKSSLLGKYLGSPASIQANAPAFLKEGQIGAFVTGQQVLRISYAGPSAAVTKSVLAAIVQQLREYNDGLTSAHDQAAVAYDKEQVKTAEQAVAIAKGNVNDYVARHPRATPADPSYASLVAAVDSADTQLGQANTALSQATGTRAAGAWSMQVLDPPSTPFTVRMGKKKMLELILGGVFGGLLVSFLAVIALTPARKELWEDELPVGKPAVRVVPAGASVPTAPAETGPGPFSGERRFTLSLPSEPVKER